MVSDGRRLTLAAEPPAVEDYQDLYENAPCGYLSTRPDGRISNVNRTFAQWIGYPAEVLVGRRFQDLLNIAGKIYYETHFAPLLRMQGFFNEVALDLACADGSKLPVLVNAAERRDELGVVQFIRITVFNATDRRSYERELLEARRTAVEAAEELRRLNLSLEARVADEVERRMKMEEGLRQAQKMDALGQLTGGVAHDFNNLLTIIMGGLDMIRRRIARLEDRAEAARLDRARDMAWEGAVRAAALTRRLLTFSRRQPLDPKPLDVNRLITEFGAILSRTLTENCAVEVVKAEHVWHVRADRHELENALLNLAVNARDAMPQGGVVVIATENVWLEAQPAHTPERITPGAYVLISVADTGTGMPPETLARVFEPFFTTKPSGRGTGLGLSQVYGFVRQSGGHVAIDSEVGRGTTVKIYLPRYEGAVEETQATEEDATSAPRAAVTILVVEDDDDVRAYTTEVLREKGYTVLEALHGRAAVDILRSRTDVAVLFADVALPGGMGGRELGQVARQMRPKLKILFTTGYVEHDTLYAEVAEPGVDVLLKPFTHDTLLDKLRRLLGATQE